MYLPTRAKAAVRRVFSPTDNDDITGSDATKLDRTLAVARGETVQFLDDGTPDGAELEPLSSGD
jgi:hypothetical protein